MNPRDVIRLKKSQNPQYEYMWTVLLPSLSQAGLSGIGNVGPSSVLRGSIAEKIIYNQIAGLDDTQQLNHRVYSIDVPFTAFESKKNLRTSTFFYTPVHNDIGTVTLRVDELEDGMTLKYFTNWQNLIANSNGTYNLPFIYKRPIFLYKLGSSGDELHFSTYTGLYPTEIAQATHSFESGGILQYNITLQCDAVQHNFKSIAEVRSIVEKAQSGMFDLPSYDKYTLTDDLLGSVGSLINKGVKFF